MMKQNCMISFIALALISSFVSSSDEPDILAVTVATRETDGFKRYIRSLKQYGFKNEVFGLNEEWKGGEVDRFPGGGQKVNILIRELEKYKNDEKKVILFTDSYDAIVVGKPDEVLEKFKKLDARIVFGAESFCWPDPKLESAYPEVEEGEKRFLNSGGFIGYASDIYEIITSSPIKDDEDDQLFYTKIFLNRQQNIKLDKRSQIFQNLNGALDEVSFIVSDNQILLTNNVTKTKPLIIHGNGPTKIELNRLGNYLANSIHPVEGCIICNEDRISIGPNSEVSWFFTCSGESKDCEKSSNSLFLESHDWPDVTMAIFIETPTPFIREFFEKIAKLNYPKSKISLLIHNRIDYHKTIIEKFFTDSKNNYHSLKYISPENDASDYEARTEAIKECIDTNCKYYFSVDSIVHFDNPDTLKLLIEQNRGILTPVMTRPFSAWATIWGAITTEGYYEDSFDYHDIINRNILSVWNVPLVRDVILIKGDLLKQIPIQYAHPHMPSSVSFAAGLRRAGVFMFATNMRYFGHLIYTDAFNTSRTRPELFEITTNYNDWAVRYISPDYFDYLKGKNQLLQPCPDVFWFPVVTDEFCDDLITTMEAYGKWSGGNNNNEDPRLSTGYENVPTVDIHMTQIDFQTHWLYFLRVFIQPIQRIAYIGYFNDPPNAPLNFVVRYRPGEQDHLTPHNDASTYTMNIALNTPQVDFQGGGCRFVRYNCSVTDTRKGWAMIHPGRLTHYHEGLRVTGGTRYIMVSFIDP